METIKIKAKSGRRGQITWQVPPHLRSRELDLVIVIGDSTVDGREIAKKKYDFSDLTGRLKWKGNAVKEQRRLRNEW